MRPSEETLRAKIEATATASHLVGGVVERPDGMRFLSPLRANAFLGLLRVGNMLDQRLSTELEARHGLNLRSFEVLLFLAVFTPEGRLRMSELTKEAPLSQSRVSRLVADLEARGLVKRTPADTDGRGVTVSITASGIEKFKAAQETHLQDLDRWLFSHLTDAETHRLAEITQKLIRNLSNDTDEREIAPPND